MNTSYFNAVYAMGSIGETLLAAPGSVTCIVDGDQSIISGCVAHILENIDIEHSVGHVINSALQCHHENYHSCTKSLLVMTAMWLREMDSLVQQGVPLDAVLEGFHQAIDRCVQQLQCTKIAVGDILSSREPRQRSCTGDGNSGDILDSSCDRLNIDNSGRMLDDSSCDRLHSDNSGRMLDDSSCDRLHSDNSGRMLDDSSCDRLHSDNSGRMLDDSSCDRLHSDNSGRMLVDNLCNSLHDHQSEHAETSNAASKNVKPTILPQSHNDIGDDDDDISWYFDDLNLNSPDDDALEMLMNTMGGMQQKLGCFTDDDTTSCRDRSGHVVSCDQSGDISPTVSSGVPILGTTSSIGGDKGMQPDTLSPQEEKTKCQRNQTSTDESLVSDKQAKLLSIMEELSQTSKLLVKCNQAISSHAGPSVSSATDSNADRSSNIHPIAGSILDSNNGSISNCDTDSVVGSNSRSLIHNADNMNPNLKSDIDSSRSAECESGVSCGFICNANVSSKYDGSSRARKNGSKFTSDSTRTTSVSAHPEDSDDEFSSCFDDVEIHAENAKRKKQFGEAVLPPCDQNGVQSADSDMLNGSRHFRSFQSLCRVSSTQESCCSTTSETICLKSSRHLRNTNNNHAPLEDRTLHTMSPSEVVTITTSGCHCNAKTESDGSDIHGNLDDTTLGDTPAKSHVDTISTEESWDDHPRKISSFIHCLGQGCEDILDAVTETMLRQLKSDQLKPDENLRFEVSRVHTLTSVGPMRWDVIDGLVMETDMTQLSLLSASARPRRVLLVNGDVSLGFHHQGFTERTKTSVVSTVLTPDTKNQSWLDDTSSILSELEVGGILVRGSVSGEFKELCYTRRIVVFDRVPYKVLQGMAESCLKEPTVYISEATEDNVADDVIIRPWSCDWMDHLLTSVSYALVQPGLSLVQTVIILHPCCNVAKMKEEKYWHCAHRLHNMLTDGAVLPGGGATEQACVAMLQCDKSRNCQDENNLFSSLAGQHVAAALENFVQLVHRNSSFAAPDQWNHDIDQTEGNTVYDCLSAKLEAWRTAEYLVGVVLGADMEVVTGVGKNFIRAQRGDILGHV